MIELNLLPEELKKRRRRIELPDVPIIPISVGLVAVLAIIQFLMSGVVLLCIRQQTALGRTWQELAPKKAELDQLKKKISVTNSGTQAIESLMAKRLNWSQLLNELSNSLTANIWFTELKYSEKIESIALESFVDSGAKRAKGAASKNYVIRSLNLSGCASGRGEEATTYVARFIRALKDNQAFFENFDDVELISIKQGSVSGQDVMNFTLVCRFKPEKL
ncbi:MAG: hypothetical protein A2Z72_00580 [Omnitrophica bacterium RBG_13_46_9]|nr:MAG: hypothetical protein A2Z72_00580 [Omnitrophica bacterium RBG_13_46_9]